MDTLDTAVFQTRIFNFVPYAGRQDMRQEHIFNNYEVFNLIERFDPLKTL